MNQSAIINLNSQCENALIDKPFHEEPTTWIDEYNLLFNNVETLMKSTLLLAIENRFKICILTFYSTYLKTRDNKNFS